MTTTTFLEHELQLNTIREVMLNKNDFMVSSDSIKDVLQKIIMHDDFSSIKDAIIECINNTERTNINEYLKNYPLGYILSHFMKDKIISGWNDDLSWVNENGKLPKRLIKRIKECYNVKLTNSLCGIIGDYLGKIADDKLSDSAAYIDFTNCFNWNSGDFSDDGSCYWSDRKSARDTLEHYNSLAMRFYDNYDNGIGRVWIVRYNNCGILYNCYHDKSLQLNDCFKYLKSFWYKNFNEILYGKKIELSNLGRESSFLYINSGSGLLFSTTPINDNLNSIDLRLYEKSGKYCAPNYTCENCNCEVDEDDIYTFDDDIYCENCYNDLVGFCEYCGCNYFQDDLTTAEYNGNTYCENCYNDVFTSCENCSKEIRIHYAYDFDDNHYCQECFNDLFSICDNCNHLNSIDDLNNGLCLNCQPELL
jgi:hypothetical protein